MLTIRTAQLDILPGNIRANWALIEKEIALAKEEGSDLLVLPEMCLTGYLIGDLWDQNAFLREAERYNDRLREAARDIMIAWGNVAIDWTKTNDDGRPRKYNAAFVYYNLRSVLFSDLFFFSDLRYFNFDNTFFGF